ncbi:DNA cytosine methyltransferase [Streptomyces sp. H27-G5]|uniref:DNA cytosine methyltransferase n=1 Tax=Streptomyces sp. H27-G5 TaxID=2996698 RepID=UPI00226DE2B1|nr:DNA cytosine methyltransferase [Streptomyces sp. H27-G5]MCY0924303.1 DNA cytosine methyltransferase [Streptomyces sp. H27-G5]
MRPPRVLDLCSGAGGAAMGYHQAGFDVVGVDINPQPRYPFEFHQGDAIEFVTAHGPDFDLIHASWPCQSHSTLTKGTNKGRSYPDLIPAGRAALLTTGRPYVIENVQSAPIRHDLVLCGEMFDLAVIRHRVFEVHGFPTFQSPHVAHRGRVAGMRHGRWYEGPYFAVYGQGGGKGTVAQWQTAMGIDWTDNRHEIAEAIPPAYTRHLGGQFLAHHAAVTA